MKNNPSEPADSTHNRRMSKGRPKIAENLEKTNLTLEKEIKKAAMKLAASRRQSLSSLVTELLERALGQDGTT